MTTSLATETSIAHQSRPSPRLRARKLLDRAATLVVTTGGVTVIICIVGLLALFFAVIAPLWREPKVEIKGRVAAKTLLGDSAATVLALGCDEYQQIGFMLAANGAIQFYQLTDFTPLQSFRAPLPTGSKVLSAQFQGDEKTFALGSERGELFFGTIDYQTSFQASQRIFQPVAQFSDKIQLDSSAQALTAIACAGSTNENFLAAGLTADQRVALYSREVTTSLFGPGEATERRNVLKALPAKPTVLLVENSRQHLFVGFENGLLQKYNVESLPALRLVEEVQAANRAITQMGFLIGERSLVVGDADGRVTVWFAAFDEHGAGAPQLRLAHVFQTTHGAVTSFAASQRNRSFIIGNDDGTSTLLYSTNERTLHRARYFESALTALAIAPKGDGALLLDAKQNLLHLALDNPHPEASWKAFFGKIWYEGYGKPDYVWQSSGGTDDFEPKLSLIPLIFGTLKGTLYALSFAMPLGVLSALYVSQFMHAKLRGLIKPVMEIMAALPSVVLGFIAGLWLAPRVQPMFPGLFTALLVAPVAAILFGMVWQSVLKRWTKALRPGIEVFALVPVLVAVIALCLAWNEPLEKMFFAGDFREWLLDAFALHYDQRNAFIVGLVMGFAVIPIIFTVSEDALSNVPKSMVAASLALGATPWQTALHVVLPTASPGIFSATMIGLGRAVGETMIVLMATGNTPLMEWNPFNGFRTLSANIAVEIPEAPAGGTLFRTLFLSALLLFAMTFVVNTIAEVIRQRMRTKYERA